MWFDQIITVIAATVVYTIVKDDNVTLSSHLATVTPTYDFSVLRSIQSFGGDEWYLGLQDLTTLNGLDPL